MLKKTPDLRFQGKSICAECRSIGVNCSDFKKCQSIKVQPRSFDGIRFTADGFDCALPVTIDSHNVCAYECLYCFSDNITGHAAGQKTKIGQTSISKVEGIFAGKPSKFGDTVRKALKYDRRNAGGFPTAVQLGGLCDAGDSIEQNQGWLLRFLELAIKYNQPVRMSTKSAIFLIDDYFNIIKKAPHLFWVAFSIITDDVICCPKLTALHQTRHNGWPQ